jgi:hypothetical protein
MLANAAAVSSSSSVIGLRLPSSRKSLIVGDAVPRLRIIAINWNLQSDLGAVAEFPASSPQLRVDLKGTGLGFVESP